MLIVYKGMAYHNAQEVAQRTGMVAWDIECVLAKLQDPNYKSAHWALVPEFDEVATKAAILATTTGTIFDLEIQLETSKNKTTFALATIKLETRKSIILETKLEEAKAFSTRCVETLGYPDGDLEV